MVWVPYNSRIEIEDKTYKVIKGKEKTEAETNRLHTLDQSIDCLVDENKEVHSMSKFIGKDVKVVSLYKRGFFK